jgi:hypothetical protein
MTDETDDGEEVEVEEVEEVTDSRAEYFAWQAPSGKGGLYVFPVGIEAWALANGVQIAHVDTSGGVITAQYEHGQPFRAIDKPAGSGNVKSIK